MALTKVYRREALRAIAMPLGGIGTGTIALAGDGSLRQWQIQNQANHAACVPHSFFAIWARTDRSPGATARVLQSAALYDTKGPPAPPTSSDHVVPPAHRDLLARLPGVEATEFVGRYPIAEVTYRDAALPVDVTLEALSPFIPLEAEDSGLPAVVFTFRVANRTDRKVFATLAATLQNAVGWDTAAPITGVRCAAYGGNVNSLVRLGGLTAVSMTTTRLGEDHEQYGSMVLAAPNPDAGGLTHWDDLDAFWADFSADGALTGGADPGPSRPGRTWNAALAPRLELEAGEIRTVTFVIAWHFPNRCMNWDQHWSPAQDAKSRFHLGNRYAKRFRSALDVARYVAEDLERLAGATRLARDTFYDTTLPYPLIDAVTSQMSIARTPTCLWTEDGQFLGFEGCCGASTGWAGATGGCCPMSCTHVWNYEMAVARLFPDLERTMREAEWTVQQAPEGYLPHRLVMPLYLPRPWDRDIGGPEKPALDGLLGAVLKTCREYRACGNGEWLRGLWPHVRRAVEYVWREHDPKRTGIIANEQPNTYDVSIWGANTFIGTLYLAALRAAEQMAGLCGEPDFAAECRTVFRRGRQDLDARLYSGEYYVQDVDLKAHPEQAWAAGCHSDQLLGQWWAHVLDLGHVLPAAHVAKAAAAIVRHNFRQGFKGFRQAPRVFVTDQDAGLLICTWPKGGRPKVPTLYSDEVWTGIEYEVAGLLLFEGKTGPALKIIKAVRARYDGRKQNPWNDIECGDHYVRAMASWALLEAASGYTYDAGAADIGFAPVLAPKDYRAAFVARDGWGTFAQKATVRRQTAEVRLARGTLEVRTLRLKPLLKKVKSVTVTVDGKTLKARSQDADGRLSVSPSRKLVLRAGQTLTVTLSG
ncbi:MAG TPA: GH116 family glycosyl-hydrolase [Phycisphaerae bacterium]|nr:GH116 family glycosyl-hydrolase [Phycisphaerae bacterium]